MFVDDIDPENLPAGWHIGTLNEICTITMGQSPEGESLNQTGSGDIFYQGRTDFGIRFPYVRMFTNSPKKHAKKGDTLLSVRAPVGDINIANNDCCIGRGIAAIQSKLKAPSFTYYVMWSLQSEMNKSNDDGTVFGSINKDALHSLTVVIPDNNAISSFENRVAKLDQFIGLLCTEIEFEQRTLSILLSNLSKK
jgi:type I restriction enzyme S subunit